MRDRLAVQFSTQTAGASKPAMQVRFIARSAIARSNVMSPGHRDGHEPSPVTRLASLDAGGTVRRAGRYPGLDGPACQARTVAEMHARHWSLPPDRLVIQSGGPPEASAGIEGLNAVKICGNSMARTAR